MIDIKVPTVGESISEVTLLKWTRKDGDYVERDEVIAELESEKATFEVNAEKAGVLKHSGINEGDTIKIGDILASIDENGAKPEGSKAGAESLPAGQAGQESGVKTTAVESKSNGKPADAGKKIEAAPVSEDVKATPVASAMIADKKVDLKKVTPSGYGGKILKDDVLAALSNPGRTAGAAFTRDEKKRK